MGRKVFIDEDILISIAESIRKRTGSTEGIYPGDMPLEIEESIPLDSTQTFILVDEDGNEIPAVLTNEEIEITATPNDIRKGTTAVTGAGIIAGEKEIPTYHTNEGKRLVPAGSRFILPIEHYNYTKLQAIICSYNTSIDDSVSAEKVVIEDSVYEPFSTDAIASVVKDAANERVDLGIANDSGKLCLIRYFMYKEIY